MGCLQLLVIKSDSKCLPHFVCAIKLLDDCLDLVGGRGEDGMCSLSSTYLEISLLGMDGISPTNWKKLGSKDDVVCINRAEERVYFVTPRFVIVMVESDDFGGLGFAVCHCEVNIRYR